jgi:hypothetical protein
MNKNKLNLVRPTPEEEAAIAAQLAEDPDTYEWTDEDWANAQTTQELFPETHEWALRQKKALEAGLIQRVTVTLDRETIAWFKAQTGEDGETGGTRWLELVAQTLRDHAQSHVGRNPGPERRGPRRRH